MWTWSFLPGLCSRAFAKMPDEPLPVWASKNVFLDRKMTTKPGFYDPDEFPWTWFFQEIIRTRVDPETGGPVTQITVLKSSVAGFTEAALNGVRYQTVFDPANVIFSIDSRVEAATINEVRLQPTLKRLGQDIFTEDDDDAGKFLLKLRRCLIYFLGSYSAAAFANKMCELAIADELEEHRKVGSTTPTIEDLLSRLKSAARPLLILLSKPKLVGGPIDTEHKKGSQHVYEIPCPHCGGYQELLQDQMKFDHCRDMLGEWDFARVLNETFFECIHCKKPITEDRKRWFNDRSRARFRRTAFDCDPSHISLHISDFYGYHAGATWGKLAIKYINSRGDFVARQGYRNHHEGLPWEIRETKTEVDDILRLRGTYKRGTMPKKPLIILAGGDVGLDYVKGVVAAIMPSGEVMVLDNFTDLHPDDFVTRVLTKTYLCLEDGKAYPVRAGFLDGKYRKLDVHRACLKSQRRVWPVAGVNADLAIRSITFNKLSNAHVPKWFGVIVFIDRDAKHDLYTERIESWVNFLKSEDQSPENLPPVPRLWFFEDLHKDDELVKELCNERLIEVPGAHAAKQFVWKRFGPNHGGDALKIILIGWRYLSQDRLTA